MFAREIKNLLLLWEEPFGSSYFCIVALSFSLLAHLVCDLIGHIAYGIDDRDGQINNYDGHDDLADKIKHGSLLRNSSRHHASGESTGVRNTMLEMSLQLLEFVVLYLYVSLMIYTHYFFLSSTIFCSEGER